MTAILKIFLPVYFILFSGLAMFGRSYAAWKHTGIHPYKLGSGDPVHDYVGKLLRLTLSASALVVVVFSFLGQLYSMLVPIPGLTLPMLSMIGITLLVLALIWVLIAQIQMGDSWRIGIDDQTPAPLIQHGLFGVSRNPIFLGMLVMLTGMLLTLPMAAMLLVSALGSVLIHIQVRLEESFLLDKYGASYNDYQKRVRRWI